MSELLVNLLVGIMGTLIGAGLTSFFEIRRRRVDTTLTLFSEFNTPAMLNTRHAAADKAEAEPGIDFAALRQLIGRNGMQELWAVEAFYQKLWLLMQQNQVHKDLVPTLFGDRLAWWVRNHFEHRLFGLDSSPARDIAQLWRWMQRAAPTSQRQKWGELT